MPFCLRGTVWVQFWFETVLHEATHGTEGTVAWFGLSKKLQSLEGGKVYNEMLKQLGNRGNFDGKAADIRAEVEKISRKIERGEALTDKQTAFAEDFMSESVAIMAEQALGNAHFARQLLDVDASIVEKLLNRIADVKDELSRMRDPAAKEAFAEIRKAEAMFLDALAEKGMAFVDGKIIGANEEDEVKKSSKKQSGEKSVREAVDNEGGQEYNRKAITPYADVMAVTKESYEHRDWATNPVRSVLLVQETMRFYQQIERMEKGRYSPPKTSDGYYLVEVNPYKNKRNVKLVLTDGNTVNPSIEAVIELQTENAFTTQKVREYIEKNTNAQRVEYLPIRIENVFPYEKNVAIWVKTVENSYTFEQFTEKRKKYVHKNRTELNGEPNGEADEMAVLRSEVMRKQSLYIAEHKELPSVGCAFTANHFYLYNNKEHGEYDIVKKYPITDKSKDILKEIERRITADEQIDGRTGNVDRYIDVLRNKLRRNQRDSATASRGLANGRNGRVYTQQSGSDRRDVVNGSDSDQRDGGVKKSRKVNSQTSGKTSTAPSEVSHLTAMQKQTVANHARTKVYTKADSKPLVLLSLRNKKGRLMPSFFLWWRQLESNQ